jgi:cytochrome c-type biogenesis protein CcmH/NrfG
MSGQHAAARAVWREGLTHAPDSDKIRSAIERLQASNHQ